jgi:hypothetical protein
LDFGPTLGPALAALTLAFLLAGLVQGLTGFGSVLMAVPVALVVLEPRVAIVVTQLVVMWSGLAMAVHMWRHVRLAVMLTIVVSSMPGIVLGALALQLWPAWAIKVVAGVGIILATIPLFLGYRRKVGPERLAAVPAGFLGGLLHGSTGMAGPPVVILLANQGWPRDAFRASVSGYLGIASIWSMAVYWRAGLLTLEVGQHALMLLPFLALGTYAGTRLVHRVNLPLFQRLVTLLVLLGGLTTLITGVAEAIR